MMLSGTVRKQLSLIVALAVAGLCWSGARALDARALDERKSWPDAEEYVWLPAPEAAPILSAGYRQLWADVTWARTLVYYGSSRKGDADYRYLTRFLDNVLALDRKFKRVYRWASYAVLYRDGGTTQEDFRLSARYLERGMEEFPSGYELFWLAGIRYYMDLRSDDPEEQRRLRERGIELIETAMHKPDAPASVTTLAASMRTKLGQHERALEDLRQVILTTDDRVARAKLIERYNELAGQAFPDEALREQQRFVQRWNAELPYAPASMYVLLGDRPSPVIDFDRLATERDLFGADLEPAAPADPAASSEDEGGLEPR